MSQSEKLIEEGCGRLAVSVQEMQLILADGRVEGDEIERLRGVERNIRFVLVIMEAISTLVSLFIYAWRVGPDAVLNKPHLRRIRDIGEVWAWFKEARQEPQMHEIYGAGTAPGAVWTAGEVEGEKAAAGGDRPAAQAREERECAPSLPV